MAAADVDGRIFAIGGQKSDFTPVATVEAFAP
jgi:hypothetical protein